MILRVLQPAETLPAFTTAIPEASLKRAWVPAHVGGFGLSSRLGQVQESGPEGNEAWHQAGTFASLAFWIFELCNVSLHARLLRASSTKP